MFKPQDLGFIINLFGDRSGHGFEKTHFDKNSNGLTEHRDNA